MRHPLYQTGVDEQIIMETTGHSLAAVRKYKRMSNEMKRGLSNILRQGATATVTSDGTCLDAKGSKIKKTSCPTDSVYISVTRKSFSMSFNLK